MIKKVFHPFLLTLVPVLYLWTANVDFIAPHMVFRSIVVALLLATGLLVLAYFLARDWQQAAILTSVALLIFFLYGHLYVLLKQISPLLSLIRHRYLLAITVLFLATVFLLISRYKKIIPSITLFLSIMGVLLVSFMSARLLLYQGTKTIPVEPVDVGFDVVTTARTTAPDIYYIILDAYGRQDVLWDIYRYDNSEFIQALEERGFYIAHQSNANYMQTLLSLSSSLNMSYLDEFVDQNGKKLSVPYLTKLVVGNRVRKILNEFGYKMIAFDTLFEDLSTADVFLELPEQRTILDQITSPINAFEELLIDTTAGKAKSDQKLLEHRSSTPAIPLSYSTHAKTVVFTLTELGNVAKIPGKKFVIAHVVSPHPPFMFTKDGKVISPKTPYSFADGDDFKGERAEYISGYSEQIQYINNLTLNAIDEILINSNVPPVIIIQGDHGPGAYLTWGSLEESNIRERMGIINAYYFPDQDYTALHPSISPVNSFRVVLNKFFGADLVLLPDHHFFSSDFNYSLDNSWTVNLINV